MNLSFKLYTKVEGHASIHKTTWIVTQISKDTEDLPRPSNTTSGKTTFWHHLGFYFIILIEFQNVRQSMETNAYSHLPTKARPTAPALSLRLLGGGLPGAPSKWTVMGR